jgi:hypothetical protein
MKNVSYDVFRHHPELRQQIVQAAHRQRAHVVAEMLARLFNALKPRPSEGRASRWIALHRG